MTDNLMMLCVVLAVVAGIAVPFIRRAIRHKKAIGAYLPEEEITVEVQSADTEPEPPRDQTAEDIFLFRFIMPEREQIGSKQTIRIRQEYYDRLRTITQVIGKNETTMIAYLDNVLKAHFDDNRNTINTLYRENMEELFKPGE